MVTIVKLRLKAADNFKMCYVVVIFLRGLLLVFPIKSNQNTIVEIDMCL